MRLIPLFLALLIAGSLWAQPRGRPNPRLLNPEQLDPGEGKRVIEAFRTTRIAGDYSFFFELEHFPSEGENQVYDGRLWGTWTPQGPLTRVRLNDASNASAPGIRLLTLGGPEPKLWIHEDGETRVDRSETFRPIMGDLTFTPFEIQMPFVFWEDYAYEGTERVKGRDAHFFLLYPPADFPDPRIGAVRVAIDAKFNAMLKAEILSPEEELLKTFRIVSIKKVQEVWIVKTIDLLDEQNGKKTRFTVVAAAMRADLPDQIFQSESLADPIELPAFDDHERVD